MTQNQKLLSKKADKDFVKLYRKAFYALGDLAMKDGTALCVFLYLVCNMDGNNALIINQETIAKYIGLTRQTVSKKIKYLEEHGFLQIKKLNGGKTYVMNDSMVWTSYYSQHIACMFEPDERNCSFMYQNPWKPTGDNCITHTRKIK